MHHCHYPAYTSHRSFPHRHAVPASGSQAWPLPPMILSLFFFFSPQFVDRQGRGLELGRDTAASNSGAWRLERCATAGRLMFLFPVQKPGKPSTLMVATADTANTSMPIETHGQSLLDKAQFSQVWTTWTQP